MSKKNCKRFEMVVNAALGLVGIYSYIILVALLQ